MIERETIIIKAENLNKEIKDMRKYGWTYESFPIDENNYILLEDVVVKEDVVVIETLIDFHDENGLKIKKGSRGIVISKNDFISLIEFKTKKGSSIRWPLQSDQLIIVKEPYSKTNE